MKNILNVHEGKKGFKCDFCGNRYTTNQNLIKHIDSVPEGKNKFRSINTLGDNYHVPIVLNNGRKLYYPYIAFSPNSTTNF